MIDRRRSVRGLTCVLLMVFALPMAGCSTARPWLNVPLQADDEVQYDGRQQIADPSRNGDVMVIVSFSGGGSRAAAFAHATLAELDAQPFEWNEGVTTLAREIDMVTGVSGGSIAAAHLALHGLQDHLTNFPVDFLDVDFQARLIRSTLSPSNLYRMTSPWKGRGHVLADALDRQLFHGATFGHLAELTGRPYLIIGATDVSNGSEFDFASDQFALLCSSVDAVPLSFAVAASSAVPLVFSPMTLQNHVESCPSRPGDLKPASDGAADSARTRLVRSESESFAKSEREYVHLVDGAVSDNLGLRRIADYVAQTGGIRAVLELLNRGIARPVVVPRRIVFLSVNSETPAPPPFERSGQVPGTLDVLGALVRGSLGRHSRETALVFDDAIDRWRDELRGDVGDVDIFSIEVNLGHVRDDELRSRVLAIPTAFRISAAERESLREAARVGLSESTELRRFMNSVGPALLQETPSGY